MNSLLENFFICIVLIYMNPERSDQNSFLRSHNKNDKTALTSSMVVIGK